MSKGARVSKKMTTNERLDVLEKMAVRLSLQMQAILKAIHTPDSVEESGKE